MSEPSGAGGGVGPSPLPRLKSKLGDFDGLSPACSVDLSQCKQTESLPPNTQSGILRAEADARDWSCAETSEKCDAEAA
jgi:hypothetical protein